MDKVLLVDDEKEILRDRSRIIESLGFQCLVAKNGKEAIDVIKRESPEVVLTDQKMPKQDGFDVLKATMEIDPDIPVILFTGYGTIESAVQAMKMGAFEYIQKPFFPEMMEVVLKKAIEYRRLRKENIALRTQIEETYQLENIVGESDTMKQIAKRVLKVAKSEANVIIFGESGTGKELIARSIHRYSPRKNKPFIPLDCVALPTTLLESELFGFEKGAFTGAIKLKPGVFELAEEGTLFLDEISELDPHLQAKLLRVLQERQFRRIGGEKLIKVDVRIISATNRNPERAVKEKRLREDLYYRLNVVPIYLPPLRDRREDIPHLVHHFIKKYNPFCSIDVRGISNEAMHCIKEYLWPGNVRELENVVHRAMSLTDRNTIGLHDLPDDVQESKAELTDEMLHNLKYREAKDKCLEQFGKRYVSKLLEKYQGNISKVARAAGISRKTLYRMLENYGIDR